MASTELKLTEDLTLLRDWLRKVPYLVQDYDDPFLLAILRRCKGKFQKAKAILQNLNSFGMQYPEYFGTYDPLYPPLQEFLTTFLTFPLPRKTPDGGIVFFTCLNSKFNDASKSHILEFMKYTVLTGYVLLWENDFGSGQMQAVFDVEGVGLSHIKDITPMTAKRIIKVMESDLVARLNASVVVRVPYCVELLVNMFKDATKSKFVNKIFMYNALDKIAEHVPQEILPKEYGGSEESVFDLHDKWKKKVESYRQRFLEEELKMRKLDSIRPRMYQEDEMAGIFRQLNVD